MKFNHLTLATGHNRISDISEIDLEILPIIESYFSKKETLIMNTYILKFETDRIFTLSFNGRILIECQLFLTTDPFYFEIKENYNIDTRYHVLCVTLVPTKDDIEGMIELSKIVDWSGDFERCVGHVMLQKVSNKKDNN